MSSNAQTPYRLSEDQLRLYENNGYLVLEEFIDHNSLDNFRERFYQICRGEVPRGSITVVKDKTLKKPGAKPEDTINKVQDILYDDLLGQYIEHPRLLDVVSQIIGDNITALHSMLINKPPGSARHHSHQDLNYFPIRPADKIIAAWTAIDYVDEDNGCLYMVPGSHRTRTLFAHGSIDNAANKLYHGIVEEETVAPLSKRVDLIMRPGDTVIFHPCMVHGSRANVSKRHRKAMTAHFVASECDIVDITGTAQEIVARELEAEAKRRGYDMTFAEAWLYRCKLVKGVKSKI